jgi:hypothetical protein
MPRRAMLRAVLAAHCALGAVHAALAQETSADLSIKTVAEIETRVMQAGHETVKLAPAIRLVPGDQVVYTLEIRNVTLGSVAAPEITYAIPVHMAYLAGSATGPGAEVSYSADGGHVFDRPENLRVPAEGGPPRTAQPADYTHIRWNLKHALKSKSVAFARFRAVVK